MQMLAITRISFRVPRLAPERFCNTKNCVALPGHPPGSAGNLPFQADTVMSTGVPFEFAYRKTEYKDQTNLPNAGGEFPPDDDRCP
jgi:hypothetical protein